MRVRNSTLGGPGITIYLNEYRNTRKSGNGRCRRLIGRRQQKAREVFEGIVTTGQADTSSWLALAFACAQLGNNEATLVAVDRSLDLERGNIRAIIFKADQLEQQANPGRRWRYKSGFCGWRPELSDEERGLVTSMPVAVKENYKD